MPLCPYGSKPKTGAPAYVWLTWLDAQSWLGLVWSALSWIGFVVPPVLKEINSFCAVEPPQPIAPTNADLVEAARDPKLFEALIQYIKDGIHWWVWSNQCECNPVPGGVCIDGNAVMGAVGSWAADTAVGLDLERGTKFTALMDLTITGLAVYSRGAGDLANRDLHVWDNTDSLVYISNGHPTPAGVTIVSFTPLTILSGQHFAVSYCTHSGSSGSHISSGAYPATSMFTVSNLNYGVGCSNPLNSTDGAVIAIYPITCPGATTTPAAPPIPGLTIPDFPLEASCTTQDVCNLAQQVLQSVTLVRTMLDLVQRRVLPFAWIPGPPYAGLTGTGIISVRDVIGVSVDLTVPGGWGSTAETPRRLIPSVGSLQGFDGTRYSDNLQLHYEHELLFFDQPWASGIRYNLRQGVVATITPLLPEP
jgi:hypothetical protein